MSQKTVFVGLSGGVDSSVAALRLKQQGYRVVGVFIKVWHPDFLVCNWEQERLDAMRVAAHLEIPFLTCNAEVAYRDEIARYFINEYQAGRTPNPDVMCNKYVKFGAFITFAKTRGADYIATGHYAIRTDTKNGPELHRGLDTNKDQSYFLYQLSQEQLEFSLFPIGDTCKGQIRAEAARAHIPTAAKKDSQGVCFLGHIDIKEFLSHFVDIKPGLVTNLAGRIIGTHEGALIYTIGQRHGFRITESEGDRSVYYVVDKNISTNTVVVDTKHPELKRDNLLMINKCVLRSALSVGDVIEAASRYRQKTFKARVHSIAFDQIELETLEGTDAIAIGQSCVLYRGSHCLGGGIIG